MGHRVQVARTGSAGLEFVLATRPSTSGSTRGFRP
jgi:hypothetical protein